MQSMYQNPSAAQVRNLPDIDVFAQRSIVRDEQGHLWTTSRAIAQAFRKQPKNVIRAIESLECSEEFSRLNFEPAEYIDSQGKPRPCYRISREGAMYLIMGFTGKEAAQVKELFVLAFRWMEDQLRSQSGDGALTIASELAARVSALESFNRTLLDEFRELPAPAGVLPGLTNVDHLGKLVEVIAQITKSAKGAIWKRAYADFKRRFHKDLPLRARNKGFRNTVRYVCQAGEPGDVDKLYLILHTIAARRLEDLLLS